MLAVGLAAQRSANAVLDRNKVETGDTFSLRILVNGSVAAPQKVDFSSWKEVLPAENIRVTSDWTQVGKRWQRQYTLVAFDSAQLVLPPVLVQIRPGDTMLTNPVEISVWPTRTGSDVSDADGIRDIQREQGHWTDYWPWAAGGALLLAVVFWMFRKKPAPAPIPQPVSIPIPTHEITLQQLTTLEQKKPWKHGQTEQYYASLSMILREYLERRFHIPAMESTTREILPMLQKTDFPVQQKETLQDILHQSDLMKYAQITPSDSYHERALIKARQLVMASSSFAKPPAHFSSL